MLLQKMVWKVKVLWLPCLHYLVGISTIVSLKRTRAPTYSRPMLPLPQFGPGPMQQHGFARVVDWEIAATSADPQPDDLDPEVQLVLTDTDFTRSMWWVGGLVV